MDPRNISDKDSLFNDDTADIAVGHTLGAIQTDTVTPSMYDAPLSREDDSSDMGSKDVPISQGMTSQVDRD
ncbi:hypothetical protein PROFUN_02958 [Planoprotostelium fungivorum]|uniref:Uncharacterized protein n=1 Tax=Planoprotostelium fungivorum TaxID=1890364 RepID=A0A2P6NX64_9EUKA|nr:hypothetical protein PROFUN_02958 [Planoprotostelium fungivorum]